jgi:DDE superfamily endonuclease
MVVWKLPPAWTPWTAALAQHLHGRLAWRLAPLLLGVLFARGRRTVASWLRAAGLGKGFAAYYYLVGRVGRASEAMASSLLRLLLASLPLPDRLVFGLDDTPTKRYGPKVQGAGIHHNPAPGPTGPKFLYGHVWVTLAWLLRHPRWGTIGLPLRALLYVRQKDVPLVPARYGWAFRTRLELAARLVRWLADWAGFLGKPLWVAVDGGYAKAPFLKPALQAGAVVVGRLRKDAALRDLPPPPRPGQRRRPGRPRTYGVHRISLAKRAGHKRGWQQVEVVQYGARLTKTVKTFLATWPSVGGVLRVVLVREESSWIPFFCTDPSATVEQVLGAAADRASLEQDFHDVKEVEGVGQQQVRDVWANVGAFHLGLWAHALTELWAWAQPKRALCDRQASPWDDTARRPSHADRRKALQRHCVRERFSQGERGQPLSWKTRNLIRSLIKLAC